MLTAVLGEPRSGVVKLTEIWLLVAGMLTAKMTAAPSRIDTTAAVAALFDRTISVMYDRSERGSAPVFVTLGLPVAPPTAAICCAGKTCTAEALARGVTPEVA